MYQLTQRR